MKRFDTAIQPTLDEWRALFDAIDRFKQLAPWEWMAGSELIGVQNPETDEIGYGCVMGNLGELMGLAFYLGSEGLLGFHDVQYGGVAPEENIDAMFTQKCLMVTFDDRTMLDQRDRDLLKKLGVKPKGRAWPWVRSHEPGLVPWFIDAPQCRFLTVAIQQILEAAARAQSAPGMFDTLDGYTVFVRTPQETAQGLVWSDTWIEPKLDPPRFRRPKKIVPSPDEGQWLAAKKVVEQMWGVWEIGVFHSPMAVIDGPTERPFYPRLLLCVDHQSGAVLAAVPHEEVMNDQDLRERILELIITHKLQPEAIDVVDMDLLDSLNPLCRTLGIDIGLADELPAVEEARAAMIDHFMGL